MQTFKREPGPNPTGKIFGQIYKSGKKWRWRTRSFRRKNITANGGETFDRVAGALKGLMLHGHDCRYIEYMK